MDDTRDLMTSAMHEIRELRRVNQILGAKVEVMEFFGMVLNTAPARQSQGMSVDVAWQLEKKIDELKAMEARSGNAQ